MSGEQQNQQTGQSDTSELSQKRQAELKAAYAAQKDADVPYKGVEIRTLGELQWIMQQRNWSGELVLPEGMTRANLSDANLGRGKFEQPRSRGGKSRKSVSSLVMSKRD
jgi:hypothetical protein